MGGVPVPHRIDHACVMRPVRDLRELAVLVSLGCVLRLYPELVGRDFTFSLLCLPFDDPGGRLAGIAGVPLSLNAERAMAFWPDSASEWPFRNANPVLYRAYTAAVQSLLGPEHGDEAFRSGSRPPSAASSCDRTCLMPWPRRWA